MAVRRITETDVIEVKTLNILIFGSPSSWKTSLAQTAEQPYTLDFDKGIHRSFNRKTADQLEFWSDLDDPLVREGIHAAKTVIVDTVGRALDLLTTDVLRNRSHGSPSSGLNQQGWGALKNRFGQWVTTIRGQGKDIVFLAHSDEKEKGEERWVSPDIQGGTYKEVMKIMDLVGYLHQGDDGQRLLDFRGFGKTPGKDTAAWGVIEVPSLAKHPACLADLLASAKTAIGKTAAASAAHAAAIKDWSEFLKSGPGLADFNARLKAGLAGPARAEVWDMIQAHARGEKWSLDKVKKEFLPAEAAHPATNGNGHGKPAARPAEYTPGVDDPEEDEVERVTRDAMQNEHAATARN